MNERLLDNPAWEALNSLQQHFSEGNGVARKYRSAILPFTGCRHGGEGSMEGLDEYLKMGESFYTIGDLPVLPMGWQVEQVLPCAQMLLEKPVQTASGPPDLVALGAADAADMFDLINSIQPGYYLPDTRLLGTYFGIKENGKLIAMAGERMRLKGFNELSAICTLPACTGRGYAQKLVAALCNHHAADNIVSFLHVALSNQRAIRLYEHMGFVQRRTIVFTRLRKK